MLFSTSFSWLIGEGFICSKVSGKSIILIDTYKRNIKRIYNCDIYINVYYGFTPLNETKFLISKHENIYLLTLVEPNYIVLKGYAKLIGNYEKPLR